MLRVFPRSFVVFLDFNFVLREGEMLPIFPYELFFFK